MCAPTCAYDPDLITTTTCSDLRSRTTDWRDVLGRGMTRSQVSTVWISLPLLKGNKDGCTVGKGRSMELWGWLATSSQCMLRGKSLKMTTPPLLGGGIGEGWVANGVWSKSPQRLGWRWRFNTDLGKLQVIISIHCTHLWMVSLPQLKSILLCFTIHTKPEH